MNIYIAGASTELYVIKKYMSAVRALGHTITVDWVALVESVGSANPRSAPHDMRHKWSQRDLDGVYSADILWLIIPDGHSIGCWLELGAAIGIKTVHKICSGDWRTSIFTSLADRRFDSHDDALEWLKHQ